MGCASSRTTRVKVLDPSKPPPLAKPRSAPLNRKTHSADLQAIKLRRNIQTRPDSTKSAVASNMASVVVAEKLEEEWRQQSAKSFHSVDSGISLNNSRGSNTVGQPVTGSRPGRRPLTSAGAQSMLRKDICNGAGARQRLILDSLKQEGLLSHSSTSTSRGGLVYEIPLDNLRPTTSKGPPKRLQLTKPGDKKLALEKMRQNLKSKLDSATQRRKEREQEKVTRSKDKDRVNLEVKLALMLFEKEKETSERALVERDLTEHALNKEQYLDAVRHKQRLMRRVRTPTLQSPLQASSAEEIAVMSPKVPVLNIDELPVAAHLPANTASENISTFHKSFQEGIPNETNEII